MAEGQRGRFWGGSWRDGFLAALWGCLVLSGCASVEVEVERKRRPIDPAALLHHFTRGNEAFESEDYPRAILHYQRGLKDFPRSVELHYNLGLAYYHLGLYGKAVPPFEEALRIQPGLAEAHYNLALCHDKLYQAAAAHAHYAYYQALLERQFQPAGEKKPVASGVKGGERALARGVEDSGGGRNFLPSRAGQGLKKSSEVTEKEKKTAESPASRPSRVDEKWWNQAKYQQTR